MTGVRSLLLDSRLQPFQWDGRCRFGPDLRSGGLGVVEKGHERGNPDRGGTSTAASAGVRGTDGDGEWPGDGSSRAGRVGVVHLRHREEYKVHELRHERLGLEPDKGYQKPLTTLYGP